VIAHYECSVEIVEVGTRGVVFQRNYTSAVPVNQTNWIGLDGVASDIDAAKAALVPGEYELHTSFYEVFIDGLRSQFEWAMQLFTVPANARREGDVPPKGTVPVP
jgi:hypothetical protein